MNVKNRKCSSHYRAGKKNPHGYYDAESGAEYRKRFNRESAAKPKFTQKRIRKGA